MAEQRTVLKLDDPRQMRALAHPLRLRLLGLLRSDGPATATMLGDETDASPALVSYHLRSLAAHLLIEEAPELAKDGRERWWRAAHSGMTWNPAAFLDTPERAAAAGSLMSEIADRYADAAREWLAEAPEWSVDWVDAADMSDWRLRLTPDSARKLRADLADVIERYSQAPVEGGAEFVRLIVHVLPRRTRTAP